MDLGSLIKGRRALVTGASSGLGRPLRAPVGAQRRRRGRRGTAQGTSSRRSPRNSVRSAHRRYGSRPDCRRRVVCAAGLRRRSHNRRGSRCRGQKRGISGDGLALNLPIGDFDAVVCTNLRGVWLVATEAARRWKAAQRGGAIVNIASIQAEARGARPGRLLGIEGRRCATHEVLALEWARFDIRVNALETGYIPYRTDRRALDQPYGVEMIKRIPMRRLGEPSELDGPLLLLSSSASSVDDGFGDRRRRGHLVSPL